MHFLCKTGKGWTWHKRGLQRDVSTAGEFAISFHMSTRMNLHFDPEYRTYSSLKHMCTVNQEIHAALKSCSFSLKMLPRKSSVI